MAKCKMKQLALAMGAALGGLSFIPSAQAVHVSQEGLGQVLLFPYYTTRGGWSTLINLTNTSNRTVAAKVRFHEAYNSRDVFDFTLILSPHDVWTAAVENNVGADGIPNTDDDVPQIRTTDNSCTVPPIPVSNGPDQPFQPFKGTGSTGLTTNGDISYLAEPRDGGPTIPGRMRQGYIKVLMKGASNAGVTSATPGLAGDAIHIGDIPRNCGNLVSAFSTAGRLPELRAAFPNYNEGINPLKGSYNFINIAQGLNAGGNPVALADFYRTDPALQTAKAALLVPGANAMLTLQLPPDRAGEYGWSFHEPNLSAGNTLGRHLTQAGTLADSSTAAARPDVGANAIFFALRRINVINQWTRQTSPPAAWNTETDWVVTMPSKRYYVDAYEYEYSGRNAARADAFPGSYPERRTGFQNDFVGGRSCDPVTFRLFDREEGEFTRDNPPVFSPSPTPPGNELCHEANIISFDESYVLDSPRGPGNNTSNVATLPGPHGWLDLQYTGAVITGLPTIGFSIIQRIIPNGLNEAYIIDHAYTR